MLMFLVYIIDSDSGDWQLLNGKKTSFTYPKGARESEQSSFISVHDVVKLNVSW